MVTVGMDEVGRGCWAGPLVMGAVILGKSIGGLKDSKQLSRHQRHKLAKLIEKDAKLVCLGWVWPEEIDEVGLTEATKLAMERCLEQISCDYDEIIIDGTFNFLPDNSKCRAQVKADCQVACVSAASIVAKVARDDYMINLAKRFPSYGFDKHVGYGTKLHIDSLRKHGPCKVHRLSYKPVAAA